jgi:hypothetical protein
MDIPMTGQVDFNQFLDPVRGDLEDGEIVPDTGVIDEDAGGAELFSDLNSGSIDCLGVGYVALDVMSGHLVMSLKTLLLCDIVQRDHSPDSSRSGKGETSKITTLTPFLARDLTISSPIPEHPPVTTATSSFQFHR